MISGGAARSRHIRDVGPHAYGPNHPLSSTTERPRMSTIPSQCATCTQDRDSVIDAVTDRLLAFDASALTILDLRTLAAALDPSAFGKRCADKARRGLRVVG